jgi:NAD-dependent SIR2 family protein deacetylase
MAVTTVRDGGLDRAAATIVEWSRDADFVVVGAGSGLSAAAGLDFGDRADFAARFPSLVERGLKAAYEMIGCHDLPQAAFWGFWAVHVEQIRFADGRSPVYENLRRVVGDKDHFVLTSNVDAMFARNGFDPDVIWTIQGDYALMQCLSPCSQAVWPSEPAVQRALEGIDPTTQKVSDPDCVPRCIHCGGEVFLNVRGGRWFIDRPYHSQRDRWRQWINERAGGRLLLIDIGSGFNTPGVVRWPLEQMALELPAARLVRINLHDARVPQELKDRALSVTACAREVLDAVAACNSSVAERG